MCKTLTSSLTMPYQIIKAYSLLNTFDVCIDIPSTEVKCFCPVKWSTYTYFVISRNRYTHVFKVPKNSLDQFSRAMASQSTSGWRSVSKSKYFVHASHVRSNFTSSNLPVDTCLKIDMYDHQNQEFIYTHMLGT